MTKVRLEDRSPKKFGVVLLLWLFLGFFGGHRFYVGRGSLLYTITVGYLGIGYIIDLLAILTLQFRDNLGLTVRP
jgi:TM2 domain-containing membrane protein YozV